MTRQQKDKFTKGLKTVMQSPLSFHPCQIPAVRATWVQNSPEVVVRESKAKKWDSSPCHYWLCRVSPALRIASSALSVLVTKSHRTV